MATEKRLDLVERGAVKAAIGFVNLCFLRYGENKCLLDYINDVPSVDAVEVVRCKKCRYMEKTPDGLRWCHVWCGINGMGDEGFCNYGERKDSD